MPRTVFLVDMNAFFMGCETTRAPELRNIPAAVAGDPKDRSGIILTANYKARAFGVKTTMTLYQAQKCCSDIVFLKPNYKLYCQMSEKVMAILKTYSPVVEQASIDEAFLDMTSNHTSREEVYSIAVKLMDEIKSSLGLWCSIGISENKFLAKMAADMKKPLGITELYKNQIQEKLWCLPVKEMYGIGKSTAEKLKGIGIFTIGDITKYGSYMLSKNFGKQGKRILELANGNDNDPVLPRLKDDMKSTGRSTTLLADSTDLDFLSRVILSLSEEIGTDARNYGKKGKTVQITIKYSDFSTITRQVSISPTNLTKEIAAAGIKLLKKNWSNRPIRLIGITLTNFDEEVGEQLSLFEPSKSQNDEKEEKLEKTVDDLRKRFGKTTIKRASLINDKYNKRRHE